MKNVLRGSLQGNFANNRGLGLCPAQQAANHAPSGCCERFFIVQFWFPGRPPREVVLDLLSKWWQCRDGQVSNLIGAYIASSKDLRRVRSVHDVNADALCVPHQTNLLITADFPEFH